MTAPQDPFSTPPQGSGDTPPPPPPAGYGAPAEQPPAYGAPAGPPAGYGAPAFGQPPGAFGAPGGHTSPKNGFGIAALVLGILSLVTWFFLVGGLLGLIAIILGVIGRKRAKRGEATNGGMALAGIITGAIGLLLTILAVAGIAAVFNSDEGRSFVDCLANADTPEEQQQCQTEVNEGAG